MERVKWGYSGHLNVIRNFSFRIHFLLVRFIFFAGNGVCLAFNWNLRSTGKISFLACSSNEKVAWIPFVKSYQSQGRINIWCLYGHWWVFFFGGGGGGNGLLYGLCCDVILLTKCNQWTSGVFHSTAGACVISVFNDWLPFYQLWHITYKFCYRFV